jgi:L-lactate dehydrogenase complex protein LldG
VARDLDDVDGAITGCVVAIAETGTPVLDAGARQGRRALTLVPDHHVCVVEAGQVVGLLPEALDRSPIPPPDHVHLGSLGQLRHRARPRRGRPGPAHLVVVVIE